MELLHTKALFFQGLLQEGVSVSLCIVDGVFPMAFDKVDIFLRPSADPDQGGCEGLLGNRPGRGRLVPGFEDNCIVISDAVLFGNRWFFVRIDDNDLDLVGLFSVVIKKVICPIFCFTLFSKKGRNFNLFLKVFQDAFCLKGKGEDPHIREVKPNFMPGKDKINNGQDGDEKYHHQGTVCPEFC
jgi:hypothetical protein